jgi:hypothetical protein
LEHIYALPTLPPSCLSNTFIAVNQPTCILHVPTGSKPDYQAAIGWKDFLNIVEDATTAIYTPKAGNFNITFMDNQFTITNAPLGDQVVVYSVNGKVISNQKATGSTVNVALPAHGMYIVTVGAQSQKVVY